ncbi:hypothetical protein EDD15DRAFT_2268530 [Pisolithus albus]|nr:hypothetical protein EDD15DRAFT_2268530 [Pisolithus albus]
MITPHFHKTLSYVHAERTSENRARYDKVDVVDIVYKADRAIWINKCLEQLLRAPSTSPACPLVATFHLVIPIRSTHSLGADSIEATFWWTNDIPHEDHPESVWTTEELW